MNTKSLINRLFFISSAFLFVTILSLHATAQSEDGFKSFSIGEYEKAEAIFSEILKDDAENVQAGYYLGQSLLMQEKFSEALNVFNNLKDRIGNKAAKGNEEVTKGQVEIGIVRSYLGLKNYPNALLSLKTAEKAGADPIDIHTFKGAYYLEVNENTKANEELEKAIALKSQNPYTYYYAGIVNIRLGDPQKAIKLFETFLKMAPYFHEAEHAKFLIDTLC